MSFVQMPFLTEGVPFYSYFADNFHNKQMLNSVKYFYTDWNNHMISIFNLLMWWIILIFIYETNLAFVGWTPLGQDYAFIFSWILFAIILYHFTFMFLCYIAFVNHNRKSGFTTNKVRNHWKVLNRVTGDLI